ncbi:MAG: M64 family metallopeptidase [Bacteroidetes bacterium]|nr:M64 family metallopeptidase [Bacteroidota bacterium]
MKRFILLFGWLVGASLSFAQTFPTESLLNNGDRSKLINIVVLGDGYTAAQQDQFRTDAQNITNYLFSVTPFKEYKNYFNVDIVKVPSNQSGAKHPATATDVNEPVIPASNPDNYFGSTFDYANIHRLLVPTKYAAISSVLASNFPDYDQVLIIVNSTEYGGSGGAYATTSINASAFEIAVHELGHSFSALSDEYWAGDVYARESANMTQQTNPSLVKWKNWYGINSVGIFQHGTSGNQALWYRPHQNCKMRFLGVNFCSVCREAIVEQIHNLASPITSFSPANSATLTANSNLTFALSTLKPVPNTLEITWTLNGNSLITNSDTYLLNTSNLASGNNTLVAKVIDKTTLSKSDTHPTTHQYLVSWNIQYTPCPDAIVMASPTDNLTAGSTTKKATKTVKATNKISGNATNVIYRAGQAITLEPGFTAENTTVFTAEVKVNPCN